MTFKMTHLFFKHVPPTIFDEDNLPEWLNHKAFRWWYDDYIAKLEIGEHRDSDFQRIERIA